MTEPVEDLAAPDLASLALDIEEPALEGETPADRQRRHARIRKRRQRRREELEKLRASSVLVTFEAYKGTQADIELICAVGGFDEQDEAITLILRNVADLARRDSQAAVDFLRIPSSSGVYEGEPVFQPVGLLHA
jgi:hypothetical protein